ncbi:MAG: SMC-Scp complex subunit ScpB [Caldilineaceae bacterium]
MGFFQLLRAVFRRVAAWSRRLLPLGADADSPIQHRTYQQETISAMLENAQSGTGTEDDEPEDEAVQPAALPIANQPAADTVTVQIEDAHIEDTPAAETADDAVDDTADDMVDDEIVAVADDAPPTEDAASPDATDADEAPSEDPDLDDPALTPLVSLLESLLFVAEDAVTPDKLAQALDRTIGEVEAGLTILARRCEAENRGIRVQRRSGRVQFVTNPAAAQAVENFLNLDLSTHLSGPALEALAVVAYQQPVTRAQVEAVRGVDCSGVLRKLQQQGLIEEVGRLETIGRPILYGVTDLFMQHFGLTSLTELPQLPEVDADALAAAVALVEEESNA